MKSSVVTTFAFLLVACSSNENHQSEYAYKKDYTYSDMVKLHYRQSNTKRGYQYEAGKLIPEHNKFWSPVAKKCRPVMQKEGIDSFKFIFVVDSHGNVIDAKSDIVSEGANCFLAGVKQIKYPAPPYENWYELVSIR